MEPSLLGAPRERGERIRNELQACLDTDAQRLRVSQSSRQGADIYVRDVRGIDFMVEAREALPEVVQARINNMEDQMYSGFLSELNLAWVSVDDTICLWLPAPQDGLRPPPCTRMCKDYVLAVALVTPDPSKEYNCDGMPQYFLAVALRECVQLFKLEVTDTEIAVQETAIEIAVDSYVKCIASTPTGRLFVGCNDGRVYELHYDEDDVSLSSFWRPRKFRKTSCNSMFSLREVGRRVTSLLQLYETQPVIDMCFDPTRHFLYALTAKSSEQRTTKETIANNTEIHVYSLTTYDGKGNGTSSPRHLCSSTLLRLGHGGAHDVLGGILDDDVLDKDVLSIHPVLFSEDDEAHLVLVTGSGWRLYLQMRGTELKLKYLVCPPPWHTDPLQSSALPTNAWRARCCAYSNGLFLLGSDSAIHCVANKFAGNLFCPLSVHVVVRVRLSSLLSLFLSSRSPLGRVAVSSLSQIDCLLRRCVYMTLIESK
jgi:hypothetical protein